MVLVVRRGQTRADSRTDSRHGEEMSTDENRSSKASCTCVAKGALDIHTDAACPFWNAPRSSEVTPEQEIDRLVADGARRPSLGEDPRTWLDEVLASPPFRRLPHPGNHTYVWPVDGQRSTLRALAPAAGPYPKHLEATR
jgi:hypothetical protein